MNVRVENSNLAEIAKPKSNVEIKGNVAGTAQDAKAQQAANMGMAVAVQQTTVEAGVRPGESQIEKIKQDAQAEAQVQRFRQQMDVVSNTMSGRDCMEMGEDGFPANYTEVDTIVTEMDKIKMELAKAGVDISTFGDGLTSEKIEELAGSAGLASHLESVLHGADLPATQENISDCEEAVQQAAGLTACGEEAVKYMLEQELPPTVENLYKAQHSTNQASVAPQKSHVLLDEGLKAQIEQVLVRAGLPVNEDTLGCSQWMLDNQIPLTEENLKYAMELGDLKLPPETGQLVGAMLEAVAEGNRPMDAMLLEGYSNADRAKQAAEAVGQATDAEVWSLVEQGMPVTVKNLQEAHNQAGQDGNPADGQAPAYAREDMDFLTAKRQLEETRLIMTAQANYALLKQGISIETKPLEELVEQLKSLEGQYYKDLLSQNGIPATEENTAVFAETIGKAKELAEVPAYILGRVRTTEDSITSMHQAGTAKQAQLDRAGEAYEALRTAPRKDMGDSIQKAFRNVDDILQSLDMEATEANQRAVRILAYNSMEITPDSIAGIKAADQKVQNMFQNLSPSVVMEMIREGVNPLEMDVEQLNSKAQEIKGRLESVEEEKFSKYLWKLEQRQEISPEERDSYIGIYRLLNQIDKTDGAVIGALANQGAELTMKNLLSAVRTNRNTGIDVTVDGEFGEAETVPSPDLSISQQIEAAYQSDCAKEAYGMVTPEGLQQAAANGVGKAVGDMTPEELLWQLKQAPVDEQAEEAYYKEQMQEFSGAKEAEAQVIQMLSGHDMPLTAYNIMAANQMLHNRNGIFKSLFDHKDLEKEIDFEEVKAGILEEFGEAVKTPEDMAKAQEKLGDLAENVMKTMIQSEDVRNVDIRDMRVARQQIELGARMAKEENYAVPVLVADELMNVQLKIVRGKEEQGRVDIMFDSPALGKVAASFQVQQESIKGYIVSDSSATINELKERKAELQEHISPEQGYAWNMDLVHSGSLDLSRFSSGEKGEGQAEMPEGARQVQTKILYGVARAFLEQVKQTGQNM